MPIPFLAALVAPLFAAAGTATAVVGTVAAAAATVAVVSVPVVVAGAAVLGGIVITHAVIEKNEEARRQARREAERNASREREKAILKKKDQLDKKINALKKQYGEDIPQEEKEKVLLASSEVLGELEGNKAGLNAKGQSSSSDAEASMSEILAMQEQCGISK